MFKGLFSKRQVSRHPTQADVGESPVFVRGMSRSGGTLLVTVLDSHPAISMSYELYPTLFDANLDRAMLKRVTAKLAKGAFARDALAAQIPLFTKFIVRAERGGIDGRRMADILKAFLDADASFDVMSDRMALIAACCRWKMEHERKLAWGLKCGEAYEDYLAAWPKARFVNLVRDGRDVLASQLLTGAFSTPPAELGRSWARTHRNFKELMRRIPGQAFQIRYETLVATPEPELRTLAVDLGIGFDAAMLSHHESQHTLFDSHHLSMEQVKQPINTNKVGRWKTDVSKEDLAAFMAEARDALIEFGYEV
jgi:hypothetical protein